MAEQDANTGGAGAGSASLQELYFPFLIAGCQATAPPRSMSDADSQFIWRDALNMTVRDGQLVGRPTFNSGIGAAPPGQLPITVPAGAGSVIELPRFVHYGTDPAGAIFCVVVTNSEIWIYYSGTWRNCTPTYAVGTLSATNGNASVTGSATLWQTRKIFSGVLAIDGTEYAFTTSSDTAMTLLANYAGATGAGKTYSIRRVFGSYGGALGTIDPPLFALIYNNNLYVAINNAYATGPAVVRVANIYTASPAPAYITAGAALTATLDYIPTLTNIVGLDVLQDSRIIVVADTAVYYSSNLSDAVWTTPPGGNTFLADVAGRLTGSGRINSTLTIHHQQGIILADQTGLADPPLRFQASAAHVGAAAAMTIKPYQGGEAFLAADGDVKFFDGQTVSSLGDHEMGYRISQLVASEGSSGFTPQNFWAWVNPRRDEYVLFRLASNAALPTKFWICQSEERNELKSFTGRKLSRFIWWPAETALVVGALSAGVGSPGTTSVFPDIVAISGSLSSTGDGLRYFREGVAETGSTPTYMLETDDLDLGLPLLEKTPQRAILWSMVSLSSISVTPREYNGSYTYSVTKNLAAGKPATFDFTPAVQAAITSSVAHRYKISGSDLRLGVFALLLRARLNGEVERYGAL